MTDSVPNSERASVDERKIHGYLLSPVHALGRHKSQFFRSLGYDVRKWSRLQSDLLALVRGPVYAVVRTDFGTKYEVRSELTGPNGRTAKVVTIWMVLSDEPRARLVTAYPEE